MTLLIQRSNVTVKNVDFLIRELTGTCITELSIIQTFSITAKSSSNADLNLNSLTDFLS